MKTRYAVQYGDLTFGPFKSLKRAQEFVDGLDTSRDELWETEAEVGRRWNWGCTVTCV